MRRRGRAAAARWLFRPGVMAILDGDARGGTRRLVVLARALRAGGVRAFQLRTKTAFDRQAVETARALRAALSDSLLFVNDRCDVAAVVGADGVHLGQDDLPAADARRLLGAGALVGVSAGSPAEVGRALRGRPDYVSLGPAFRTRTKRDAGPALGPEGIARLGEGLPKGMPRLAVGGITPDNVGGLIRAGVTAAAVASWWTRAASQVRAARWMLQAVHEARRCRDGRTDERGRRERW